MGKQWKLRDFNFLGLQNHCRWWLHPWNKKMLAPWKKSCDWPRQHIETQRRYFAEKVRLVNAMVFPVVMYGCESRTIKKAEGQRIDAFELWCWRKLLRVPWTESRSNQSTLKGISPEYSLKGLMVKLKLQYFGHLKWRPDSLEKMLMLGKIEGGRRRDDRGWDGWMPQLNGCEFEYAPGVGDAIQPSHPLSSLLLPPSIFPSIRLFSNESALHIRWPKYWSFSYSISPSNEYSGLILFRMDWLDLLAF